MQTLVSVPQQAAKAYRAGRHAFRVLKHPARQRAQYFLKVFAPELTEEAAKIVDDAVKTAELELLGWTSEEADQAWGQACLSFDHGGHDMQPRSSDRYLLYLAAWLESIDDDEDATSACDNPLLHIERITRKLVLEHPLLAPLLDEIYEKARLQNPTLPSTLEKFVNGTLKNPCIILVRISRKNAKLYSSCKKFLRSELFFHT